MVADHRQQRAREDCIRRVYVQIAKDKAFDEVRNYANNFVPYDGDLCAKVAFIGEAPGADEDRHGVPFIGAAGRIFADLLNSVGLTREEVYVTNVLKYRPPGNRDPSAVEMEVAKKYLIEEIKCTQAKKIVLMGRSAAASFGYRSTMLLLHGTRSKVGFEGREVWFSYHPASALYDRSLKKLIIDDFSLIFGGENCDE